MKQIPLTHNKFAIIDDEDFERVSQYKWVVDKRGTNTYARTTNNPRIYLHRFIMNSPKGVLTDHKNRNGLDNRKSNLRICTSSENGANKGSKPNSSSQYKGVHFFVRTGKWSAQIKFQNIRHHLGYFVTELEAAKVRDQKAMELQGEFAYLNFPIPEAVND